MAKKNKTVETEVNVADFVNSYVEQEWKREDSFRLIELMQEWSGSKPKMWGPTIIGFGSYHYKYASGHEGDAPMPGGGSYHYHAGFEHRYMDDLTNREPIVASNNSF